MREICIGTANNAKIEASKKTFLKIWLDAKISNIKAPSKVRNQPLSDEEAITGAENRASFCLSNSNADLCVGIESNITNSKYGMFVTTWTVLLDRKGNKGVGSSGKMLLPSEIAEKVKRGEMLSDLSEKLFRIKNLREKEGIIGVLTKGHLTRTNSTEHSILMAISGIISSEYY